MTYTPPRILQPKNNTASRGSFYCIHGMTSDSRELEPLAQFLAEQGFVVYLSTLIGHEAVHDSDAAKRLGRVSLQSWKQQVEWELEKIIKSTKGPVFLLGTSFGGLLAMHLSHKYFDSLKGTALLSIPVKFRFLFWEIALGALSFLPEILFQYLGTFPKAPDNVERAFERYRLESYSIGAAVRLIKLRRAVLSGLWPVGLPTILLHAPEDKIVDPVSPIRLKCYLKLNESSFFSFPNGTHELAIGLRYKEVSQAVCNWAQDLFSNNKGR